MPWIHSRKHHTSCHIPSCGQIRAPHISLTNILGQVKSPVRQIDLKFWQGFLLNCLSMCLEKLKILNVVKKFGCVEPCSYQEFLTFCRHENRQILFNFRYFADGIRHLKSDKNLTFMKQIRLFSCHLCRFRWCWLCLLSRQLLKLYVFTCGVPLFR